MAQDKEKVGIFKGVDVYYATRKQIEENRWSTMYYYVIRDDGNMMFCQGKVIGYLQNGNLKLFDKPREYPRDTAENEMMRRVTTEDELLKKACDTSWTNAFLKNLS